MISSISAILLASAQSGGGAIPIIAAPPPSSVAIYLCSVAMLDGPSVTAEVRVDFQKNRWTPWVSVKSSQENILASMPDTVSLAKRDSIERKAFFKLGNGKWQSIQFDIISSQETITHVEFYREDDRPWIDREPINAIFATGICRIKFEGSK